MKNSYLIALLQVLNAEELQKLQHFLYCEAFNTNRRACQLYDFILQFAPDFEHENLTNEAAFVFIQPDATEKPVIYITKLRSVLLDLVQQFVSIFSINVKHETDTYKVLDFCRQRNALKVYQHLYKKASKELQQNAIKDVKYYYEQFQLAKNQSDYLSFIDDKKHKDHNFLSTLKNLDAYYIVQKLYFFCHYRNRQRTINVAAELPLEIELLQYIERYNYLEDPIIRLWYNLLCLLRSPRDRELYLKVKTEYFNIGMLLAKGDRSAYHTIIENSAISIFQATALYKELFELYKNKLSDADQIAYLNGYLQPMSFFNIVFVVINLHETAWVSQFVAEHHDRLIPDDANSSTAYSLAQALIELSNKNYSAAHTIAFSAAPSTTTFKIIKYRCLIKIYYEDYQYTNRQTTATHKQIDHKLGSLTNELNNFAVFLAANKQDIPTASLQNNRKFNNFVTKLWGATPKEVVSLENKIDQSNVSDKVWLLEQTKARKER
jgi:tRNA A37 N6-isopentenylltransferase MiaA